VIGFGVLSVVAKNTNSFFNVTPYSFVNQTSIFVEHAASIFSIEEAPNFSESLGYINQTTGCRILQHRGIY
jgi:hypothetical protein